MSPFPNIALMGRARSGKDTIAAHLAARFAYARVAFADPLKEMALGVNPILQAEESRGDWGSGDLRLAEAVNLFGWEAAKDQFPEVRRLLQRMGQGVREIDQDFWLAEGLRKADGAASFGIPVIFTDVRYPNEYTALRNRGFRMVRVLRPASQPISGASHDSETALDSDTDYPADFIVLNGSTLSNLRHKAECLAENEGTARRRNPTDGESK